LDHPVSPDADSVLVRVVLCRKNSRFDRFAAVNPLELRIDRC